MTIPNGIKLRHLSAFLDVCEAGTISEAARRMHISQPALSKTIADLELMLGQTLFDRVGRKTVLTAHGETFRRHAIGAMQSLENGCQALRDSGRNDVIRVGVLPTVSDEFFPSVALEFYRSRPGPRITVITGPNHYLIDRLRAGNIDLMLGRMPAAKAMTGLQFEFLYEEPIKLVGRAGHPMAGSDPVEALRSHPLILPNRGAIIRTTVDQYLNAIGLTDAQPAFETVSLPFARSLLERSDLLWFISQGVVARDIADGTLIEFPLGSQYMSGAVGLTTKFAPERDTYLAYLVALLHRHAAQLATGPQ